MRGVGVERPEVRAHFSVIVSPPDPMQPLGWPSDMLGLESVEFYPDGWLRVRVSAPLWMRPDSVRSYFVEAWGVDCSCDLLDGGCHFPIGSVWDNYQRKSEIVTRIFRQYDRDVEKFRRAGFRIVDN